MQSSLRMEVISIMSKNKMSEFLIKDDFFVTCQDESDQTVKAVPTIQVIIGLLNSQIFLLIEKAFAQLKADNKNAIKHLIVFVRTEIQRLLKVYFSRYRSCSDESQQTSKTSNINRTRFGLILECMTHHLEYLQC